MVWVAGGIIIHGRSDATLNRGGVRLGTAEFYSVVEGLDEVTDSLVVHLEDAEGGAGELLLFVVLAEGLEMDEAMQRTIAGALRTQLSPRHVPDEIHQVRAVPRYFVACMVNRLKTWLHLVSIIGSPATSSNMQVRSTAVISPLMDTVSSHYARRGPSSWVRAIRVTGGSTRKDNFWRQCMRDRCTVSSVKMIWAPLIFRRWKKLSSTVISDFVSTRKVIHQLQTGRRFYPLLKNTFAKMIELFGSAENHRLQYIAIGHGNRFNFVPITL